MSSEEVQASIEPSQRGGSALSNSLTTFIKFGGAATALGILVGWLYQQGLMDGMELPSNLFPTKFEDLLFMTYLAALVLSAAALKSYGQYLLVGAACALAAGLAVGVLLSASLVLEERLGLRGWATRLLQKVAQRRIALGMVVGTTSVIASTATVVGTCAAAVLLVLLPLPAYMAGREEGTRVRSMMECVDGSGALLTKCAEATFDNGEKVVGTYLAGGPGSLALRVDGNSVIFTQAVRTLRFGSKQRPVPAK